MKASAFSATVGASPEILSTSNSSDERNNGMIAFFWREFQGKIRVLKIVRDFPGSNIHGWKTKRGGRRGVK